MVHHTIVQYNKTMSQRPHPDSGLKPIFRDVVRTRTRVTAGKELLPGVSQNSYWVRRVRDIMERHISDLGGFDSCSESEKNVVRRAAVLVIECERLERRFAQVPNDKNVSFKELQMYSTLANTLRRLLDMAGLERRTRDITPTIDAYVQAHVEDPDGTDVVDADYVDIVDTMREAAE